MTYQNPYNRTALTPEQEQERHERYKKELAEEQKANAAATVAHHALAQAVVNHLDGWELEPEELGEYAPSPTFRRTASAQGEHPRITFRAGSPAGWVKPGRIHVSGWWPSYDRPSGGSVEHFRPWRGKEPKAITMAATRPPAALAQDILRRYLPDYLPEFGRQAENKAQFIAHRATEDAVVDKLAAIAGATPYKGIQQEREFNTEIGPAQLHVEVKSYKSTPEGTVDLRITNASPEQAGILLTALLAKEAPA